MDHLETEARNPASTNFDELTPLEIVRLMNAEDARVPLAVAAQAEVIARAIELIADRLRSRGRLIYVGAGTSGRLGVLDATECPPTFNAPAEQVVGVIAGGPAAVISSVEGAEDHPEFGERDLAAIGVSARDVVVGIASSGRTPYVLGAIAYARRVGAATIGISCNADSDLIPEVDLAITPVVGPEVLSGSTRLKAGTATKLVLNMLSTGAMVRLGKVYGNLMVDLRATNNKLRARTNRIVRQLAGLDRQAADDLLTRCNSELKTAVVAFLADVDPEEARQRLAEADGRVRQALVGQAVHATTSAGGSKSLGDAGMHSMPYEYLPDVVLGIDGGGTKNVAILARPQTGQADKWTLLGRGESGPSNLQAVGADRAFQAIDNAVNHAFQSAGLPRTAVSCACLGLAGAGRAEDQALIRRWALENRLARDVEVTTDVALLLAAGTPEGWGIALVAGTGSIALARSPDGRTARAGGWGFLLGDEGSGYAVGLAALQAVARASDGRGPQTMLTQLLLSHLQIDEPSQLIAAVYQQPLERTSIASLSPLVLAAASAGDCVASAIVDDGALQLALVVSSCAKQLSLTAPIPMAIAGGLLLESQGYRDRMLRALAARGINAEPLALVHEPAEGAVRLALAAMGRSANR